MYRTRNIATRPHPQPFTQREKEKDCATVDTVSELTKAFDKLYGAQPRIYRAPGRVNLIGEHTDYNEGFVMPMAIDFSTFVAISKRGDLVIRIHSDTFKEDATLDLSRAPKQARKHWS